MWTVCGARSTKPPTTAEPACEIDAGVAASEPVVVVRQLITMRAPNMRFESFMCGGLDGGGRRGGAKSHNGRSGTPGTPAHAKMAGHAGRPFLGHFRVLRELSGPAA